MSGDEVTDEVKQTILTDDEDVKIQQTHIQGYLTGDHECGLLFPEPDGTEFGIGELRERGLYLRDLMPDGLDDNEWEFSINVAARRIPDDE